MRLTSVGSVLLLLSVAAGCRYVMPGPRRRPPPPPPTIPAAADVARIHLTSIGSSLQYEYDVTLTKQADIDALIGWLHQVDWSPSRAEDLSNVGLAEVGQITITTKDGATYTFGLSGGSVIVNRWEWRADTDRLTEIAKQAGAKIP